MRTSNVWTYLAALKVHAWRQGSFALRAIDADTKLDILLAFLLPDQPDQSHQQTLSSLFLSHHHSSTQKHVCACVFVWTLVAYISIQYVFAHQSCLQDLCSVRVRAAHTHTSRPFWCPAQSSIHGHRGCCETLVLSAATTWSGHNSSRANVQRDQRIRRQPLSENKCNDRDHISGFLDSMIVFNWIKKAKHCKKKATKKNNFLVHLLFFNLLLPGKCFSNLK